MEPLRLGRRPQCGEDPASCNLNRQLPLACLTPDSSSTQPAVLSQVCILQSFCSCLQDRCCAAVQQCCC